MIFWFSPTIYDACRDDVEPAFGGCQAAGTPHDQEKQSDHHLDVRAEASRTNTEIKI